MENPHIEERNGGLYIAGTKIMLDSIVYAFRDGASPERILEDFDRLTLPHAYGAISYYLDHQAEVDAYIRKNEEHWAELERTGIPPSQELLDRMERARQKLLTPQE